MKKYIIGIILSIGIFISPAFSQAAGLTTQQANSLIAVVQSAPGVPASAFVNLITSFSNITVNQATSLIAVVQSAPSAPVNAFVNLLMSFTSDTTVAQVTTQTATQPTTSADNDAVIKSSFSNIRVQAELYYSHGNSYTSVCSDPVIAKSLTNAWTANGKTTTECSSTATTYAASSPLFSDHTKFWCVDSTGASRQTTISLGGMTSCQTQLVTSVPATTATMYSSPRLVYPVGGEVWKAGQTYTVKWTGNVTQLTLIPAKADGSYDRTTYQPEEEIIPYSSSFSGNSSGALSWAVPASIKPGSYVIHIANMYGGFDSKVFTIEQKNELNITSPTNNASLEMGKTYSVSWTGPEQQIIMRPINSSGGTDSSRQEIIIAEGSQTPIYNASVAYTVNPPAVPGLYSIIATSDAYNLESKISINVTQPQTTSAPVIDSMTQSITQNGTITITGSNFSATENYVQIGNRQFGPIVAQNGTLITLTPGNMSATLLAPSTYTVNVIKNPGYYTSNTVSLIITATQPVGDLVVQDLTWTPSSPNVSSVDPYIYFTFTVKNNGTGSVVLPSGTKFALTKNGVKYGGLELGILQTLAQGETKTMSSSSMQAPNLRAEAGTFTITLTADSTNIVSETNEGNNTISKTITIVP